MAERAAIHLIIHGRVQGVGYRAWTAGTAKRLGLAGWVRNRRDGTVEAVFTGTSNQLAAMRAECERGPLAAKVTHIEQTEWQGELPVDFAQRPTL